MEAEVSFWGEFAKRGLFATRSFVCPLVYDMMGLFALSSGFLALLRKSGGGTRSCPILWQQQQLTRLILFAGRGLVFYLSRRSVKKGLLSRIAQGLAWSNQDEIFHEIYVKNKVRTEQ